MSPSATDRRFVHSMKAAKRSATDFDAESDHEIVIDTSYLLKEEAANDFHLSVTLPKPNQRAHSHVAVARPLPINVPQYPLSQPQVTRTTSTSSSKSSESHSSVSGESEFPLTPGDEPYSPTSESVVFRETVEESRADLYLESQSPCYRRLGLYDPMANKQDVINWETYRHDHRHPSPKPAIPKEMEKGQHPNSSPRRRKALCIGINYKGHRVETLTSLKGCVNDAHRMRDFLIKHGKYEARNIKTLSDGGGEDSSPTKQNILTAIHNLVHGAKKGDMLFFHYSGHGRQVPDQNGDEIDKLDEVLVPVDFEKYGYILDDELHEILVKSLPEGCHLTAFFDACHSGTILDLPYNYRCDGQKGDGLDLCTKRRDVAIRASVVSWSGCKDKELAREIKNKGPSGPYTGVMTDAFIYCLTSKPQQTFQELYDNLVERINKPDSAQKPQLGVSCKLMHASEKFVF